MRSMVNLLNEIGMLAHIPRSGFAFLGSGKQSVAEHSFRVTLVAYTLAKFIDEPIDAYKLMMLCLFHDLPEARTGDLNYMQKKYVAIHLDKTLKDIEQASHCGPEIVEWIEEYEKGESLEAKIAHDADQLELLLVLKQEHDLGNSNALEWFQNGQKRLRTTVAKQLSQAILETPSNEWWLGDKHDPHWVDGGKAKKPLDAY